jgi:hypothetical protein
LAEKRGKRTVAHRRGVRRRRGGLEEEEGRREEDGRGDAVACARSAVADEDNLVEGEHPRKR